MSRFTPHPSPEWKTAAQALQQFRAGPEGDSLDRVCAEALEDGLRRQWARSTGPSLTGIEGEMKMMLTCCAASIGHTTRRKHHRGTQCRPIPGSDHLRGWVQNGIITAVTIEPYGLGGNDLAELSAFCQLYNYRATIRAESAHFASRTVLIAITQESEDVRNCRRDYYRKRVGIRT